MLFDYSGQHFKTKKKFRKAAYKLINETNCQYSSKKLLLTQIE